MDLPWVSWHLLVLQSPNGVHFKGVNQYYPLSHTHTHTYTLTTHLCWWFCQAVKDVSSWAQPAPEFINLDLKDNSGTSHRPYVLWLLDSFPPLGFSARRWAVLYHMQMASGVSSFLLVVSYPHLIWECWTYVALWSCCTWISCTVNLYECQLFLQSHACSYTTLS